MEVAVEIFTSLRCTYCAENYPRHQDYTQCPRCREATVGSRHVPMSDADAQAIKREADFGWWLYDHGRL